MMSSPSNEDIFVRETVTIGKKCMVCNESTEKEVDRYGYLLWKEGMYVQHAFPMMSAEDREWLLTGLHGKCYDSLFAND